MKRFWRWLGFHVHDWTAWESYSANMMPMRFGLPIESMSYTRLRQKRHCKTCGMEERRDLE